MVGDFKLKTFMNPDHLGWFCNGLNGAFVFTR
jgi:hypothetical protein